jgi:hypothetical protein
LGRRQRQRDRAGPAAEQGPGAAGEPGHGPWSTAPTREYADPEGNTLELRGSLSPASRREYHSVLDGSPLSREDAWHRAIEFLFERLTVRWVIAGVPLEGQRELLARLRASTPEERAWVRDALRRHCAEHFPDVTAP